MVPTQVEAEAGAEVDVAAEEGVAVVEEEVAVEGEIQPVVVMAEEEPRMVAEAAAVRLLRHQ